MSSAGEIEERAVLWRLRREEPGWGERDAAELEAWLDEATAHRVAYLRAEHGFERVGRLASLKSPEPPAQVHLGRRPRWPQPFRPAAIAASLAAVIGLGVAAAALDIGKPGRAYATEVGGREVVSLTDGSRVELNTASRLRADIGETRRVVWLEKGEAYFDVKPDPAHPFVVYAGDRKVVVLGTKFSVRRDGDRIQVAVAEGKVRVEIVRPEKPAPPAVVSAGDLVVAEATSTFVTPKAPDKVANELAWRQGLLVFENSALDEAVAEFNRYNHKKLVIEDAEAGATMISGSFEAQNVEAFARLLRRAMRLNVEAGDDEIRISS